MISDAIKMTDLYQFINNHRISLLTMLIVLSGFVLRVVGIDLHSITIDEATILGFANGVLDKGYPYLMVGGMEVPLATYELVPYPLALSLSIFGQNEFAARLPAVLFSAGTTYLIIYVGMHWFGSRIALLAGLLYAVSPWSIYWSTNAFHPAQTQFFVMLLLFVFHKIISVEKPHPFLPYLLAVVFTFTFLSWEGTGFLLPILLIVTVILRWNNWAWVVNSHIWIAGVISMLVVVLQGVRRILNQTPYLMVGSGKSDVSTPVLAFTRPEYNPFFYFDNFFLLSYHLGLTVVFALGVLLISRSWNYRFVYLMVFVGVFFMTNFLPFYNAHYVYFLFPMFLLSVAAAFVYLLEKMNYEFFSTDAFSLVSAKITTNSVLLVSLLLLSMPAGLQIYDLADKYKAPKLAQERWRMRDVDYRSVAYDLQSFVRPGDKVISMAPLPIKFYTGISGDYYLQIITNRKVVFDPTSGAYDYVDKYVGNKVIRTLDELKELFINESRVWLVAAPYGGFVKVLDDNTLKYVESTMKVVTEHNDSRLMLWDKSSLTENFK